ncbi:MAG: fatty acid desaturase [Gemmatimonadetes bacterium]|nr:fatty acid desaturase [Gemmatimonadota bacterium]
MPGPQRAAAEWSFALAAHREPSLLRSLWQLFSTFSLFVAGWALMYWSLGVSYALTLLLAVPQALLLIRLFIFQHDCGHGSFFTSQRLADVVGSMLGVLTLTPYQYWKKTHAIHHATSGDLDHRGFGDIDTLTIDEYFARSRWGRLKYRVYRHPLVLFGIGAVLHFFVRHRLTAGVPRAWTRERRSILYTNAALALVVLAGMAAVGPAPFLMVQLPFTLISCSIGVWLFYVQHQFEPTYWEHTGRWRYHAAALEGSSFYDLPPVLRWFTGNIGLHHVHHLNARIPNYRLQEAFAAHPELHQVTRLTLRSSLQCLSLALWDERANRLVSFGEARQIHSPSVPYRPVTVPCAAPNNALKISL